MQTLNDTPHSTYLLHDDGIYEIVYKDTTRTAVEEAFKYERELLESATPDQTVRQMITFNAGLPPVRLIFQNMKNPDSATARKLPRIRIAILYKESATVSLLNTVAQSLRLLGISVKTFPRTDQDAAIKWLMQ